MVNLMKRLVAVLILLLLAACESNPPAPVIERPQSSKLKPPAPKPAQTTDIKSIDSKTAGSKDWRPDSHIVKKGDTLFGIGLQFGIDYKEIATANNIAPPYPIKIGQKIDLSSFKTKAVTATDSTKIEAAKTETDKTDDGVVVSPMKVEPVTTGTITSNASTGNSAVTPVLTEPKAMREPYSVDAWNRTSTAKTADVKPVDTKSTEFKSPDVKSSDAKPTDDESLTWSWPTQGKISTGFNEINNKGIDMAGTMGQAINAAAPGKVIYSGSDLRGYGKLVIIKHNKTYLSVYAHNSKIVVKEGQTIAAGQKIAEMGNTDASSTQLHFEIRRLGKSVDPAKYLNQN